jgi:hypothetical protein
MAVIADSAQYSSLVTEVCPPDLVGTALTLQLSTGFLITIPAIFFTPCVCCVAVVDEKKYSRCCAGCLLEPFRGTGPFLFALLDPPLELSPYFSSGVEKIPSASRNPQSMNSSCWATRTPANKVVLPEQNHD